MENQCYNKGCGQKFKDEENNDGMLVWSVVTLIPLLGNYSTSHVYNCCSV